jgi:hypothetical protein
MDNDAIVKLYPALAKDDEALKEEIWSIICDRVTGSPYLDYGDAARSLDKLPRGLRAMAATHWLDLSLTLDSLTWHFGNFGEPGLVAQTEAGLHELELHELAECFYEAKNLMVPLLSDRKEEDGDSNQLLERSGLREVADQLNRRAWALHPITKSKKATESSVIYAAWIRYARKHPEDVFDL